MCGGRRGSAPSWSARIFGWVSTRPGGTRSKRRSLPTPAARRGGHRHGVGQVAGLSAAGVAGADVGRAGGPLNPATALYISPTKALAADQLRALDELGLPGVRAATYDGDTPYEERAWIRAHANLVLANPDLVHRSMLPSHRQWSAFFRGLRYVVIDECHGYRGVFGAHVAQIIRRLRRVAARYDSFPVFILASATVSEPATSASRLVGLDVVAITDDASPRGAARFVLWEPPLLPVFGGARGGAEPRCVARRWPRRPTCSPIWSPMACGPSPLCGRGGGPREWR